MDGMTNPVCPQCNIAHPPLAPGEICPMAPQKLKDNNGQEKIVNWSMDLFDPLKKVLEPLLKVKGYDDKQTKDLFKKLIVDIVKIIESY